MTPDRNTLAVAGCTGIATAILAILPALGIVIPPVWAAAIVAVAAVIPSNFVPQSLQEIVDLYHKVKIENPTLPSPSPK